MRIFRTELYKICSKKLVFIGLAGSLLFFAFYFWVSTVGSEYIFSDGQVLVRFDAIRLERQIAETYAGPLTRELAEEILAEYGWARDIDAVDGLLAKQGSASGYEENFCNRFVTVELSSRRQGGEEPYHLLDEDPVIAAKMGGQLQFGYGDIWGSSFRETHMMVLIVVSILAIVAAAPVFSEEYGYRTAPVLLTTVHGRARDACCKALAAFCFGTFLYVLTTGLLFGAFALVYGVEGLKSSAVLFLPDVYLMPETASKTLGSYMYRYLFLGLVSVWASTGITLFLSAKFRQSFTALIWSVLAYLLPYVVYIMVMSISRMSRFIMRLMQLIRSLPAFLPYKELSCAPAASLWLGYLVSALLIGGGAFLGCRRYCKCQDR